MTDADKVLTQELEQLLTNIAQTGRILYPWNNLKPVFMYKMDRVMRDFFESSPSRNSTSSEPTHVADFEVMRQRLLDCLDSFTSPPFTIQRLCELMVEPKRHYKNSEKFMRGIEKNVLVVSSLADENEEPLVNNIDTAHTSSIPNGPVTNGIMSTAQPTEMESVNDSDSNDRVSHVHDTPYPTQVETLNGNAQTNGKDHTDDECESEQRDGADNQSSRESEQSEKADVSTADDQSPSRVNESSQDCETDTKASLESAQNEKDHSVDKNETTKKTQEEQSPEEEREHSTSAQKNNQDEPMDEN
ncbi:predicted protein [Nematostella vectensis]|uniref:Serine/threonine-protein phosphatase 4 regulatory subunit 2 n=1 Tax=Nematostella vectensis TaxID=45351 RepID=A7RKE9_NEMVE|nr:predicted protein [Nematostella vectensis]|eukprot:XP_001640296.1 predicted protein [Nematostella vectensis]